MKKIQLAILTLAAAVLGADTTGTWNSAAGTRMDSLAAWTWDPATPSGFTSDVVLVYDSTSGTNTNSTSGANLSVKSVTITNKYKGAWSISGRTLTCALGFSDDGVTGAHNYGNGITCNGASAQFHVGSGVGTITASSCAITMNGTTNAVWDDDKTLFIKSFSTGTSALVTMSGSGTTNINAITPLLNLGTSSQLTLVQNLTLIPTNSGHYIIYGSEATIVVSGTRTIQTFNGAASVSDSLSLKASGGVAGLNMRHGAGATNSKVILTDTLRVTGAINIITSIASTWTLNTANNPVITSGALNFGANFAGSTANYIWRASVVSCASVNGTITNTGTSNDSLQSSSWIVGGSITIPTNHNWVPGTSRFVLSNTAKATITSNNSSFYDVIDSAATGQIDSLADSLTCHDLTIKTGKFKFGGRNINLSGNFTWANTCVDTIFCRMTSNNWTFVGSDPTLTLQGTGARLLDSAKWVPQNNLTVVMDSNNTIHRLLPTRQAASQRYTMQASRKLSLYYNLDYSWSGQGGNLDTMKSSTPGTFARIGLATAKLDSQMYYKDMAMQSYTEYCTTGCVNGGNDSNIVFRDGIGQLYNTPATPTFTTNSPTFGPTTGGNSDTVTGTKFFAPCSVSVDGGGYIGATVIDSGSIWFALPAHAAGLVAFQIKNADMKTVSQNNAYQYIDTVGPISYATSPVVCTTGIAMSQTCTNASGTPDSFTVAPALPTGLSIDSGNGTISGTPTVATAKAGYLVTAWSIVGNATCYDTITVIASVTCSTTVLIRAPTQVCTVGTAITPMVHAWTGGTPDSIKVRTALPTWLTAHPATGTITGTPTLRSAMAGYRVVAYGCSDSSAVWDSIRVKQFPVFSTLLHPAGWIGYVDTIIGSGFVTTTATLGDSTVTIGYQTDDTLIWTVPTHARGTVAFIGTNTDLLKDTINFRVLVPAIGTTVP